MKKRGRLFLLRLFTAALAVFCLCPGAKAAVALDESQMYQIINVKTGLAIDNDGSKEKDTPFYLREANKDDKGQQWVLTSAGDGVFIIANANYGMAIDMRNDLGEIFFQWSPDINSGNQRFLFKAVDGMEDTYQLFANRDQSYVTTPLDKDGKGEYSLYMTTSTSDDATYFKFVAIGNKPIPNYWENETVFGVNKEPGHATYIPYASTEKLRADADRYAKPWVDPKGAEWMTLNGLWKIKVVQDPALRPGEADFWADNADVSAYDTITVPSCLEMKGFATPYYINVGYGFANTPPKITMLEGLENTVGSYRRTFTLPTDWDGKRIFLHFDGIYSAAYVWINGKYVGYTQGANNDAEFDVTDVVRQGENNVSVQVFRWSDGSYLEGQDMWHMSGIHRDVYLFATPKTFVRDHYITSNLSAQSGYKSGSMNVELTADNRDKQAAEKQVRVRLYSPEKTLVAEQTTTFNFAAGDSTAVKNVNFTGLSGLELWSAENPSLYTVEVAQLAADGTEEMAFATKYGFRHIEIKNHQVYINGNQVFFKGADAQDTHPLYGRSIDVPTMLKDVTLMKQANMNIIRASHYPRQAKMNAMFDCYGLYLMDEADVECHKSWTDGGEWGGITNMESWRPQFVDRTVRMVYRDRNHPSVIFWSLGNESGGGKNFQYTYQAVRNLDPRPIHYEGATRGGTNWTDICSDMYPSLDQVTKDANGTSKGVYKNWRNLPYFMCEYAHAMGNSVGNLQEYWDIIESSTNGIGGCIWDWVDQSIYRSDDIKAGTLTVNGHNKYYTGYDFVPPTPSIGQQGNFVNNGLVSADRSWSPELTEVKKVYQYIKFKSFDAAKKQLVLLNKYDFTDLSKFGLHYSVVVNGNEVEKGNVDLPATAPDAEATVNIPFNASNAAYDGEAFINFEVYLKDATLWADQGYAIATDQELLQARAEALPAVEASGKTLTFDNSNRYNKVISNDAVNMQFNDQGILLSWTYNGKTIVNNSTPTFSNDSWIENDAPYGNDPQYDTSGGITSRSAKFEQPTAGGPVILTQTVKSDKCPYTLVYTIYPSGVVDLKATFTPGKTQQNRPLRRIGLAWYIPGGFENVEYYARGPWENYIDRHTGSFFGRYTTTVSDMFENYAKPQTMGNRQDLRELILNDPEKELALKFETEGQVSFSALHYEDAALKSAKHAWELSTSKETTYLHFDYMHQGLGNGSCGPGTIDKYLCPTSGNYTYTIRITPIDNKASGIGTVLSPLASAKVAYDAASDAVVCNGLEDGTVVKVYNMGGVCLGTAKAASGTASISMAAAPSASYIAVMDNGSAQRNHKFVK